jgi:WD40 repeat protein
MSHKKRLCCSTILVTFCSLLILSIFSWGLSAQLGASWQVKLQIPLPVPATALAYTQDGLHIATGSITGEVTVRDAATGKLLTTVNTRGKRIEGILFTPDGNRLISISQDNKAQVWNVTDWRLLGSLAGVTATADVSPNGKWLAAQDPDHNLWIWDLSTLKRGPQVGKTGTDGALALGFTPDSKSLALAYDYNPYLIDLQSKVATKLPVMAKADLTVKQIDKNGNFILDAPTRG